MKKFGRKTTLNLRYGSDKGSHSVVPDWKGYDFMEIAEKKETNADRIRNMSDEELASWYVIKCEIMMGIKCQKPYKTCKDCILDWLQSEAE